MNTVQSLKIPESRAAAEVEVALAGREEFIAMVTTGGGAAEEEATAGDDEVLRKRDV